MRNPTVGQWYDLSVPDSRSLEDFFLLDIEEMKRRFSTSLDVLSSSSDKSADSLHRQAMAYVGIVEDIVSIENYDSSSLLPALTALKACISAGWKPISAPKVC